MALVGPSLCCFADESDEISDDLDTFVSAVTTIAQSWCEHATVYADIEMLVCQLPVENCTFTAHDSLAPYSGPYPMTIQVRTFLIKEINGWVEIALHDNLYAKPSLHRGLGVKTVPAQSTFWRAWNHCFSEELRDGVQKCAAMIVKATCVCDVSLPERVTAADTDEPQTDDRPEHQLLAFLNWLI